jgi:hypothetical protein
MEQVRLFPLGQTILEHNHHSGFSAANQRGPPSYIRVTASSIERELSAGAPDKIRTCDLCLRRAALYPAELRARVAISIAEPGRYGNAAKPGGTRKWSAAAPPELCRLC